jgi:hypothetical protein
LQALADAERAAASPPRGDTPLPALNPSLLLHGHAALDGMLRDWWHRWSKKSPNTSSLHKELASAASRTIRSSVSPALADWIKSHGEEHCTDFLEPQDAAKWLRVHISENRQRVNHSLPGRISGPRVQRPQIAAIFRNGRRLFKTKAGLTKVQRDDGSEATRPGDIQETLWESRAPLWQSVAETAPAAGPLLGAYASELPKDVAPGLSPPSFSQIARCILRAGGSAPGCDGWPYEVYHMGVNFTAHLLAQAFHAAGISIEALDRVLGPSIDLLLWIPKKEGLTTTDAQRPLQLPVPAQTLWSGASLLCRPRSGTSHL